MYSSTSTKDTTEARNVPERKESTGIDITVLAVGSVLIFLAALYVLSWTCAFCSKRRSSKNGGKRK